MKLEKGKTYTVPTIDGAPVHEEHPKHPGFMFFYLELLEKYKNHSAVNGKCPHQGVEIGVSGQCPAHGLHWENSRLKYKIEELNFSITSEYGLVLGIGPAKAMGTEIKITESGVMRHVYLMNAAETVSSMQYLANIPVFAGDTIQLNCKRPFARKP